MLRVPTRVDLLEHLPPGSVGAELGVFDGVFSETILQVVRPARLLLVDLWSDTTEIVRWDESGQKYLHRLTGPEAWQAARQRLAASIECGQTQLICAEVLAWLHSCPPRSLDWIYLDDNHLYVHVAQELELALPCLRPGGWMMGHDYCEVLPGVAQAVDQFCQRRSLKIDIFTDEEPLPVHPRLPGMPPECAYNSFAIRVP